MTDDKKTSYQAAESDNRIDSIDFGSSRRRILQASAALGGGALAGVPLASADQADNGDDNGEEGDSQIDQPEGYSTEVVAAPANFPDQTAAMFSATYEETSVDSNLPCDASNLIVVRARWEPGGNTGWHLHPGVALVNVTEGEIEIVDEDCSNRTYGAGEAFLDPGNHAHSGINTSDSEPAEAYVTFLGIPEGSPATQWVEPRDC